MQPGKSSVLVRYLPGDCTPLRSRGTAGLPTPPPRLYVVLTYVARHARLHVGSLGTVPLARGWYAYVGSAARGRVARVARHLGREKRLRWHADHLFNAFPPRRAWLVDGTTGECTLAAARAGLPIATPPHPVRFGATDCRCAGHLVHFRRRPRGRDLAAAVGTVAPPGWELQAFRLMSIKSSRPMARGRNSSSGNSRDRPRSPQSVVEPLRRAAATLGTVQRPTGAGLTPDAMDDIRQHGGWVVE